MFPPLPTETYREIFKYLDFRSLGSCVLVNKSWFLNAVGLLWQDPFESLSEDKEIISRGPKLIRTYASCLSSISRKNLECFQLLSPTSTANKAIFNYAFFLVNLDYLLLVTSIKQWIKVSLGDENCDQKEIEREVIKELCSLFFQNCASLRKLGFLPRGYTYIFAENYLQDTTFIRLDKLPNAENCLSHLEELRCFGLTPNEVLCKIAEISKNLKVLDIRDGTEENKGLRNLFEVQTNLREFTITTTEPLSWISISLRKKVQNLQKINIYCHDHIPLGIFEGVTNIQELTLCDDLRFAPVTGVDPVRQFNSNLTKLEVLDLTLRDRNLLQISSLIRKTNGSLLQVSLHFGRPLDSQNFSALTSTITSACPKLKQLTLRVPNDTISKIPLLFTSCTSLECVTLVGDNYDISETLIEMGNSLPRNLMTLCLNPEKWIYNESSLKSFLEHCEKRLKSFPLKFARSKIRGKSEVLNSFIEEGIVSLM
ncbi:3294_t:CDS:2 [Acaulospora colombiana]|uniref:3294_t:CDS:1 n=1 Tax=Acaulospora colombiana TaxID=27376 RepID=A0ACA9KRX3_9GLOM|nr:3294_t:CDS:2 [Acaulospora colombiana]